MLLSVRKELEEEGREKNRKTGKIQKDKHGYQLLGCNNVKVQDEGRVKKYACLEVTLLKPFWPILGPPAQTLVSGLLRGGLGDTGGLPPVCHD